MPVPNTINDLSTTAASNSPGGGENPFPELDDHLRKGYSFIAQLRDLVAGKLSTSSVSAFIQTLIDDADAATARTTLGAVGKTGDETVAGIKTFSSSPVAPTPAAGDNSTKVATTAYVDAVSVPDASTTVKGKVELATGPESASGTDPDRAITPSTLRAGLNASGTAPVYAARAWVTFDGTTGNVIAQGNVSGVVRNAPGVYTITFATAMSDASYTFMGGASQAGSAPLTVCQNASNLVKTTTQLGVVTAFMNGGTATNSDSTLVHVVIFR